jgi:uncharacterized protein YcfL
MKTLFLITVLSLLSVTLLTSCFSQFTVKGYEEGVEKTVNIGEALLSFTEGKRHSAAEWDIRNATKEELVYVGIENKIIKIDYRQYYYDYESKSYYIKDGFTQHLTYDISEEDIITYKNYKIQVVKANSSSITFIVLQ